MAWLQGYERAPRLVRACRATWETENPGWEVRALSNRTISDYVDLSARFPSVKDKWLSAESFSDIVRVALLAEHGGVWADSTLYCTRPLDDWLAPHLGQGLFAFSRPGPDRMISSWFIASSSGGELIRRLSEAIGRYWVGRDVQHHYFWLHYLFGEVYEQDAVFRRHWDATVHIPRPDRSTSRLMRASSSAARRSGTLPAYGARAPRW